MIYKKTRDRSIHKTREFKILFQHYECVLEDLIKSFGGFSIDKHWDRICPKLERMVAFQSSQEFCFFPWPLHYRQCSFFRVLYIMKCVRMIIFFESETIIIHKITIVKVQSFQNRWWRFFQPYNFIIYLSSMPANARAAELAPRLS